MANPETLAGDLPRPTTRGPRREEYALGSRSRRVTSKLPLAPARGPPGEGNRAAPLLGSAGAASGSAERPPPPSITAPSDSQDQEITPPLRGPRESWTGAPEEPAPFDQESEPVGAAPPGLPGAPRTEPARAEFEPPGRRAASCRPRTGRTHRRTPRRPRGEARSAGSGTGGRRHGGVSGRTCALVRTAQQGPLALRDAGCCTAVVRPRPRRLAGEQTRVDREIGTLAAPLVPGPRNGGPGGGRKAPALRRAHPP